MKFTNPITNSRLVFYIVHSVWCIILCTLFSCKKKEIGPQYPHQTPLVSNQTVIVGNEGNFGWGNASLTLYNPAEHTTTQHSQISGAALGDVVQSVCVKGGDIYVVVNNSGKIERLAKDFTHKAQINGLNSPRYMAIVNQKGYVTDLYSNSIYVVNLSANTVSGQIPVSAPAEQIIAVGTYIFAVQPSKNQVLVIDAQAEQVYDSVAVQTSPTALVKDKNNRIWVLCGGNLGNGAALVRINPANFQVEFTLPFPSGNNGFRLAINSGGERLYYLSNGDLYETSISAVSWPAMPLVAANGRNFYGLGVNPFSGDIYMADAADYTQQGTVYRYDSIGTYLYQFQAGIIPQALGFVGE